MWVPGAESLQDQDWDADRKRQEPTPGGWGIHQEEVLLGLWEWVSKKAFKRNLLSKAWCGNNCPYNLLATPFVSWPTHQTVHYLPFHTIFSNCMIFQPETQTLYPAPSRLCSSILSYLFLLSFCIPETLVKGNLEGFALNAYTLLHMNPSLQGITEVHHGLFPLGMPSPAVEVGVLHC